MARIGPTDARDGHFIGVRPYASLEGGAMRSDGGEETGPSTVWANPDPEPTAAVAPQAKPPTVESPFSMAPPERNEWSEAEALEVVRQALLSGLSIFVSPVLPRGMTWRFHEPALLMVSQGDFEAGRRHTIAYIDGLGEVGLVQGDKEILRSPAFAVAALNIS